MMVDPSSGPSAELNQNLPSESIMSNFNGSMIVYVFPSNINYTIGDKQ